MMFREKPPRGAGGDGFAIVGMPGHADVAPIERRQEPRTTAQIQALIAHWEHSALVDVIDFSSSGCRVKRPQAWSLPKLTRVRLYLIVEPENIRCAQARVVWVNDSMVGLQFLETSMPQ